MTALANALDNQTLADQTATINTINNRGKNGWVSTWSDTDTPRSWIPSASFTARFRLSAQKPSSQQTPKPSSHQQSAGPKPFSQQPHPAHKSPTPPAQPRRTQYGFEGNDKRFSATISPARRSSKQPRTTQYNFKGNGEKFSTARGHTKKRAYSVIDEDDDIICEIDKTEFEQRKRRKTTKDDDDTIYEINEEEFRHSKRSKR